MLPLAEAGVSIEDRGFQFADGVYEVAAVLNRKLLDWPDHTKRLARSLAELSISAPASDQALSMIAERVLRANRITEGILYIQVTRGAARRDHAFPRGIRPTLVMTARPFDFRQRLEQQETGIAVVTAPDERWARCDIKSVSLLPNVLAKQAARTAGAFEAWMVGADGAITEGSSTNAWIVRRDGTVVTHPLSHGILAGVMRSTLLRLARDAGIAVEEAAFTAEDALGAAEAFLTSTTAPCLPVVSIDGKPIGNGGPGVVTGRLGQLLWQEIARQTGFDPRL
jgi:D-alanine transaminase